MTPDRILTDTFRTHEYLAPDAEATLDAVQHQIQTRHRRRVGGFTAAAAAAAAVAVVLGASFVGGQTAGGQRAPTREQSVPAADPGPGAPVPLPSVHIGTDRLPAGSAAQGVLVSDRNEWRYFGATVPGLDAVSVMLSLQQSTPLSDDYKRGTPHDLTLAGRPAREWSVDDWYHAELALPGGALFTVDVTGGRNEGKGHDGSAGQLAVIGRNAAGGMRLDRTDPVRAAFTLSHLPPGYAVREVGTDDTRYTLAPRPAAHPTDGRFVTVTETAGTARQFFDTYSRKGHEADSRLRLVPGRPMHGFRTFQVLGLPVPTVILDSVRPGKSIVLSTSAPAPVRAEELFLVADGIRLS